MFSGFRVWGSGFQVRCFRGFVLGGRDFVFGVLGFQGSGFRVRDFAIQGFGFVFPVSRFRIRGFGVFGVRCFPGFAFIFRSFGFVVVGSGF